MQGGFSAGFSLCAPANGTCNCAPLLFEPTALSLQQLEDDSAIRDSTCKIKNAHAYTNYACIHVCRHACVHRESLIFCLQKLWILWGLYRLVGSLSCFFRMSSAHLDFLFYLHDNRLHYMQASHFHYMQASMWTSFLWAIWAEGGVCSCVNRLPNNPKAASKPCALPFMLASWLKTGLFTLCSL